MSGRHMAFPFRVGIDGRTVAPVDADQHVRDEIVQLLLTNFGERPFLPSFGGGIRRLVFERNDEVSAGITKAQLSKSMTRWLGYRVQVVELLVNAEESTLTVDLRYRNLVTNTEKQLSFQHSI
jgi:phage baseplate assembly protein W